MPLNLCCETMLLRCNKLCKPRDTVLWPAVDLRPPSETISKLPSQIGQLLHYRHTETETGPDLLKSVDILDNLCYNIRPSKTEPF